MSSSRPDFQNELPLFDQAEERTSEHSGKLLFAGWKQSLLTLAVEHLTREWDETGPLDLSGKLVVVPTRNAGRRLREALAIRAGGVGAAVFPPRVVTQDFLFSSSRLPDGHLKRPVASASPALWVWSAVLLHLSLDHFRRLFPVDPVERSLKWACDTASALLEVRRLLTESGHTFATASAILSEEDMEPARWEELARLEQMAIAELKRCGLEDEATAQLLVPATGRLPEETASVLVCGLADLRPLAAAALKRFAARAPLEILVQAPSALADHFDAWGRPRAERWIERDIPIPNPESTVHQAANPLEQASLAAQLLADLDNPASTAAIGIPDPSLAIPLKETLAGRGVKAYDPSGRGLANEGVFYLLKETGDLVAGESFAAFRRLLNCPGVADAIIRQLPGETKPSTARLVRLSDDLIVDALPGRLPHAHEAARRRFSRSPELAGAIGWARDWCRRLRGAEMENTLTQYLGAIYEGRRFSNHDSMLTVLGEVADAIHSLHQDLRKVAPAFRNQLPGGADRLEMLLVALRSHHVYPERAPNEIDLHGWIELAWEDAERLVITGMNDHRIPEAIIGHAFLPDTARRFLGVPHNEDRFARDAYLLTAMLESRKGPAGRVDLVFGRESAAGDPLRPSRLLFQCPAEELPHRTLHLFRETELETRPEARSIAFPLRPLPLPENNRVFSRLSPTAIKQYLACPFRFYLKFGLGMKPVEIDKREMDAADFGNLVHDTLEAFARDPEAAQSTEAAEITRFFHEEIDRQLAARFGETLSTPVLIQREAARKRLGWWAGVEARERNAGWRLLEPESTFGSNDWPFSLAGMTIRGRIDRLEEHPEHGIRVIDFKTLSPGVGSSRRTVDRYHLAPLKRTQSPSDFPDWMMWENEKGQALRWVDLQLPLYLLAMAEREPARELRAAYGTLGKSQGEVALDEWMALDRDLLGSARCCVEGVIDSVRAQRFWPASNDAPPWDDFGDILHPSPEDAVDPSALGDLAARSLS